MRERAGHDGEATDSVQRWRARNDQRGVHSYLQGGNQPPPKHKEQASHAKGHCELARPDGNEGDGEEGDKEADGRSRTAQQEAEEALPAREGKVGFLLVCPFARPEGDVSGEAERVAQAREWIGRVRVPASGWRSC